MIGIFILYFIGKYYHRLARDYEKKQKWLYVILGIVSYYGSSFLGVLILVVILELYKPGIVDNIPTLGLDLIGVPLGLAGCFGVYELLRSQWKKRESSAVEPTLLDDFEQQQ